MKAPRQLLLRFLRAITISACLACAAASTGVAAPPGINLSWNDCGTFGKAVEIFTCDTNVGHHFLIGSFSSPVALDSLNGNEIIMNFQSAAAAVPPWWQIRNYTDGTVGCRSGTIPAGATNFDFTTGPFNCHDYWQGQAAGGWAMIRNFGGPSGQRILVFAAIENTRTVPLEAELETYSFKLVISNVKTVGASACVGCMDQANIVLQSIKLTQPYNPSINNDILLTNLSTRNYVYWYPDIVPTRNTTWGAIKSMYR